MGGSWEEVMRMKQREEKEGNIGKKSLEKENKRGGNKRNTGEGWEKRMSEGMGEGIWRGRAGKRVKAAGSSGRKEMDAAFKEREKKIKGKIYE